MTISFVRRLHFMRLTHIICLIIVPGASSFTIYTKTKESLCARNVFNRENLIDTASLGAIGLDSECSD
jgi:hypothetical protein